MRTVRLSAMAAVLAMVAIAMTAGVALAATFIGNASPNTIVGTTDSDVMEGRGGGDALCDDVIIGRLTADNIQPFAGGSDSVNARSGDDFIYTADETADTIECGDGFDTVRKDPEDTATNCADVTNF